MSYILSNGNGDGVNSKGINGNGASGSSSASPSGFRRYSDPEELAQAVSGTVQQHMRENRIDIEGVLGPSNTPLDQSAGENDVQESSASSPSLEPLRRSVQRALSHSELGRLQNDIKQIRDRHAQDHGAILSILRRIDNAVRRIEQKQGRMGAMLAPSLNARVRAGASSGPQPQVVDVNEDETGDKARQDSAATNVPNTQVPAQPVDSSSDSGVPVIPRRRTATFIVGPDHSQETTEADTPEVQAVLLPDGMVPVPNQPLDQQQSEGEPRDDSDTLSGLSASYADLSSSAAQAPEASPSDAESSHVVEPSPSTSTITSPRPKGKGRITEPGPSGTSNRTSDDDDRHLVHEQPTPRAQAASHPPAQPGYVDPTTGIDSGVSEEAYREYLATKESSEDNEVIGDDNGSESDEAIGTFFD
ncbi:hypothetical protein CBER1_04708 [Cercospora berteroae]|uniref:Uncharacterized protein n=1 Tax=Cercospora berteroae TaxID=357750 RepID=A0A2S6BR75_9PEZI|nr:hypothetical protein CBER1_04708 [Cercospora berteroae]